MLPMNSNHRLTVVLLLLISLVLSPLAAAAPCAIMDETSADLNLAGIVIYGSSDEQADGEAPVSPHCAEMAKVSDNQISPESKNLPETDCCPDCLGGFCNSTLGISVTLFPLATSMDALPLAQLSKALVSHPPNSPFRPPII